MGVQRFVASLGWCWFAALVIALGIVLAGKRWPMGVADWAWGAGALGLGLVAAMIWAVVRGRGTLDAAMEIDRRFGLKERISSTLAMSEVERRSDVGRALVDDAIRRARRLDVRERIKVSAGRSLWLPLVPGVLAVLVTLLVSPAVVDNPAAATADPAAVKKQVKRSTSALKRKLAERRKLAEQEGLKEAERLFKRLEQGTKDLNAKTDGDRKKTLVKLNDLAQQLRERREKLGGAERIKQQLGQLKKLGQGPAEKFAKAVGRGDFKQAIKELKKLKERIAKGELNKEEREQLARQLNQMQEKLKKMADAQQAMKEELEKKIDQLRKNGQDEEASKLAEQLQKLQQQMPQIKKLGQMAQKMGQCAECLGQGNAKAAAAALEELQAGLEGMQKELDELEMLDEALGQMCEARDQMNCKECGGIGCEACGGFGKGEKPGGVGMGEGRGKGDRPEEKTDTAARNSRVKQKLGKGSASVGELVEGPNVKGNVGLQIEAQYEAAKHEAADPLTDQKMPRKHRRHAREYFDRFREGDN